MAKLEHSIQSWRLKHAAAMKHGKARAAQRIMDKIAALEADKAKLGCGSTSAPAPAPAPAQAPARTEGDRRCQPAS